MSIIEAPSVLLCLEKPTANLFQEFITAGQESINHLSVGMS
jgi:hypothetical protein